MTIHFVSERPVHEMQIEGVLDRAFGPGRLAKTSERVRERGAVFEPNLSRVAVDEHGDVVGCSRIWRVRAGECEFYFLGPLAVEPSVQREGVGASLTRASMGACRMVGGAGVVLVGALSFFAPLGFSVIPQGRLSLPGPVDPARFLWCELEPGGLQKAQGMIGAP